MDVSARFMGQKGLEENKGLGRVAEAPSFVPSMGHLFVGSVKQCEDWRSKNRCIDVSRIYIFPLFDLTLTDDTSFWLVYHIHIAHTASHPHNISGK